MKLLRNERAYRRWAHGRDGWDTYRDRWKAEAPTEYPCWAYEVVQSWGMEESAPRYLYRRDLERMQQSLAAAVVQ